MSSTNEGLSPFNLKNINYKSDAFLLFSLVSFVLLVLLGVAGYYSLTNSNMFLVIPVAFITFIYFAGLAYSEYQARYDFLKTTTSGVEYHHSPKFMHFGWLPTSGLIKYSDIQSINIIQIKTGLDLLEERMKQAQFQVDGFIKKQLLLEIHLKDGKTLRIGERLPSAGLIQAAIFIESGAKLGDLFSSFAEKFPNVANVAKNVFNKFFKK